MTLVPLQKVADPAAQQNFEKIQQLLGSGGGIAGHVTSAGNVGQGTGFTASKTATGDYTVTFTAAFAAAPNATASIWGMSGAFMCEVQQTFAGSIRVRTYNSSGVATDAGFSFRATAQ